MGGDGLDEQVFATLEPVCDHGGDLWWLYLSRCAACGQNWMIAQEERIYDCHYLRRLDAAQAQGIISEGCWPGELITYERVLKIGRTLGHPFTYLDRLSPTLIQTASDLRQVRPDITAEEIADLLGVAPGNAAQLLTAPIPGNLGRVIADYSKARTVGWTLGPFIGIAALYFLVSPYPLSYVFSVENWSRSTSLSPSPLIANAAVVAFAAMCLYQLVTIVFLGKKFVWTDGENLIVGYRNKGPLRSLLPHESEVRPGLLFDRVTLRRSGGSPILLNTGLYRGDGAQLLREIAANIPAAP
jgi:hypothetical protein